MKRLIICLLLFLSVFCLLVSCKNDKPSAEEINLYRKTVSALVTGDVSKWISSGSLDSEKMEIIDLINRMNRDAALYDRVTKYGSK